MLYLYDSFVNKYRYFPYKELESDVSYGMVAAVFFRFSAIGTVISACLIYRQVSIDRWCWSAVIDAAADRCYHQALQSDCQTKNRAGRCF